MDIFHNFFQFLDNILVIMGKNYLDIKLESIFEDYICFAAGNICMTILRQ